MAVESGVGGIVRCAGEKRLQAEEPRETERDARKRAHWFLRHAFVCGRQRSEEHRLGLGKLGSGVVGAHSVLFF